MRARTVLMICACLMALNFFGCGTDSEDTIYICSITTEDWAIIGGPIPADLVGSYILTDVTVDFYTVFGNHIKTATKNEFDLAEGYQSIDPISMEQDISYDGTIHLTGGWYLIPQDQYFLFSIDDITWADSSSGTITLDGFGMPFSATENVLTFTWPVSCFLLEEAEIPDEEPVPAMNTMSTEMERAVMSTRKGLIFNHMRR